MNIIKQLTDLHNSGKSYIIYKSNKGFDLYTDFSKKIILTKKNITSFLKKTNQKQKKLKKTDLYVGFFGYEILNYLIIIFYQVHLLNFLFLEHCCNELN